MMLVMPVRVAENVLMLMVVDIVLTVVRCYDECL